MKPDLSLLERRISRSSLGRLSASDFEFLRETLSENRDVTLSFENPVSAMLYLYKKQLKSGKASQRMEQFIVSAAAAHGQGEKTGAPIVHEEARRGPGRRGLLGGEESLHGLPVHLQRTAAALMGRLDKLAEAEQASHAAVAKASPQLAEAHANEVAMLKEETLRRLREIALEQDKAVQKEKAAELSEQTREVVKRTAEGQKERLKMLNKGASPTPSEKVDANLSLLVEGIDPKKVSEATSGMAAYSATSPVSADFVQAYSLLARFFPTDELDPSKALMQFLNETSKGAVAKNPQGKNEYTRYVAFLIKDDKGNVIAAADGAFSAGEKTNVFYLSHIAVLPEFRRTQIATLLETAILTACEGYARDAEKKLGVNYPPDAQGHKIMYAVLETEFASLRPSEISATLGRLIFHGVNGFSVVSAVRYGQSDTTWEEGKPYNSKEWKPVPLYFAIRGIGREVTGKAAVDLLRLMYNGFITGGMCAAGVEADFAYATKGIGAGVHGVPLPKNAEELRSFIQKMGHSEKVMASQYGDTLYAKEYLASAEKAVSLDKVMEIFQAGNREPPRGI